MSGEESALKIRTLFLSDIHLGTKGAQADALLNFLKLYDAETIYLVGDIVDGWRLKKGWFWPQAHNDVVQKLLRKGRKGARIIYIPGNHDEFLRDYVGLQFGTVELKQNDIFTAADGQTYLIMHGDEFDVVIKNVKWLAILGDWAYRFAMMLNVFINRVRRWFGKDYWSLSAWAKYKVKNAVNFIGEFENTLVKATSEYNTQGIICGHIHHASIREVEGIFYLNCGDWVESCSALIEDYEGRFTLLRWKKGAAVPEFILEPFGTEERVHACTF